MTFWPAVVLGLALVVAAENLADGLRAIAEAVKVAAREKRL